MEEECILTMNKYRIQYHSFLALITGIILISCEYESDSVYFVQVNKTVHDTITINLLEQNDTIALVEPTTYTYNIGNSEAQKIYSTEIRFNGHTYSTNNSYSGSFTLSSDNYEDGIYELEIAVKTSTGSENLADKNGYEVILYSRKWIVIVDNHPPDALEITKVSNLNGRVKIEWQKNEHYNFKYYWITRNAYVFSKNSSTTVHLKKIYDADSNWFFDDSYIGGKVTYQVENYAGDDFQEGISCDFYGNVSRIEVLGKYNNDSIVLYWNKCSYDSNFHEYEVKSFELYEWGTYNSVFSSYNLKDTICSYSPPFGRQRIIELSTHSNKYIYYSPEYYSDTITVYAGDKIPAYEYLLHSTVPDIVYLINYNKITKLSLTNNELMSTALMPEPFNYEYSYRNHIKNFYLSPDGSKLIYSDGLKIYKLDPDNLSITDKIDVNLEFDGNANVIKSLSNNGLVSLTLNPRNGDFPLLNMVYNIETKDSLFTKSYRNTIYQISANGKYFVIYENDKIALYSYNDLLNRIGEINSPKIFFDPVNEEQAYVINSLLIQTINCSDLTVTNEYSHENYFDVCDIDPITENILSIGSAINSSEYFAYIINVNQKKIIFKKSVASYYSLENNFSLINNYLLSCRGFKMSITK